MRSCLLTWIHPFMQNDPICFSQLRSKMCNFLILGKLSSFPWRNLHDVGLIGRSWPLQGRHRWWLSSAIKSSIARWKDVSRSVRKLTGRRNAKLIRVWRHVQVTIFIEGEHFKIVEDEKGFEAREWIFRYQRASDYSVIGYENVSVAVGKIMIIYASCDVRSHLNVAHHRYSGTLLQGNVSCSSVWE